MVSKALRPMRRVLKTTIKMFICIFGWSFQAKKKIPSKSCFMFILITGLWIGSQFVEYTLWASGLIPRDVNYTLSAARLVLLLLTHRAAFLLVYFHIFSPRELLSGDTYGR